MMPSSTFWFSCTDSGDNWVKKHPSLNILFLSVVVDPQCLRGYSAKRLLLVQEDAWQYPIVEQCYARDRRTFSRKDRALIQNCSHRTFHEPNVSSLEYGNNPSANYSRVLDIVLGIVDLDDGGKHIQVVGIGDSVLRKQCPVIFEIIIPSSKDTQFFLTLAYPLSIPFSRATEHGFMSGIERSSFQILPVQRTRQPNQAIDRIPPSVLSLIAECTWPNPSRLWIRAFESILDLALVQKSWSFLTELYFRKISSGYHIYNPQGLLTSLTHQPSMASHITSCVLSSNKFVAVGDRPDALAALLDLDLPLRSIEIDHLVFNRSKNRLSSFSQVEKFRLATEVSYGGDREIFDDIEAVYNVIINFLRLVDLEIFISSWYASGRCISRKPSKELIPFTAPFSLRKLSIIRGEYTLSYLQALLGPRHRPSLRILKLSGTSGLENTEIFTLLKEISPTLERLVLRGNTFQNSWDQPGVSPLDQALPYLTQLRYLELRARKACTSTATIALKPPLEGRSKTVIWLGIVDTEVTMSEALERTGWTDLEFRGEFQQEWQAPREEWLEIANRRDIKIRFSYDGRWL